MDQWLETRTYLNAELGAPQPQSENVYPLIQRIAQVEVQTALAGLPAAEPTSLVAGNNITITGTGVPLDPYVVSSGTTVLAAGLNTTIEGNGTVTTPYKVNVQLPDPSPPVVVSSGNALTTEVQQTADGYAVSAKPVQLTAGNFITIAGDGYDTPYVITAAPDVTDTVLADGQNTQVEGDGTIATPYRVNVTPTTVSSGDANTTVVNQNGADYSVAAVPYKLEAGPRVSLSGGDGYAAPIVVSADAVELVNGNNTTVSGDGTSVTPFRVDVNFPDAIPVISGDPQTTTVDLTPQGYSVVARKVSVVAGDNVTVTGDGYDDPYTINAVGLTELTAGINTLVVGTGTTLDPYQVNVAPPTTLENGNAATTTITQDLTATENKYTVEAKPFLLTPGDNVSFTGGDGYANSLIINSTPSTVSSGDLVTTSVVQTGNDFAVAAIPPRFAPVQGPNITITGDGYLNPYVIGASGSIQATSLVSGLNTVVSGDGSSAVPYQVAAPPPVVIESTDTNTLEVVQTLIPTENKYSLTATPFKLAAGAGIQLSPDDGYTNPVSISVDFPQATTVSSGDVETTEVTQTGNDYAVVAKKFTVASADGSVIISGGNGYDTALDLSVNPATAVEVTTTNTTTTDVQQTPTGYSVTANPVLVTGQNGVSVTGDGYGLTPYVISLDRPVTTITNLNNDTASLTQAGDDYTLDVKPFRFTSTDGSVSVSGGDGYSGIADFSVNFPPAPVVTTTATNTTEVLAIPTGYDVRAKPVQLTAGTNVAITGDGYTTPYTITASATGTATLLADGQNSTIVGDGSLATPYQVDVAPPTTIVNGDPITTTVIPSLTPTSSEYIVSAVPYQLSAGPGIGLSATDGYSAPRLLTNTRPMAPGRTVFVASSWPADADPSLYFTSLTAAETSITTATFEDPWTVVVYPGTYIEPDLQFKPDVYVVGTSAQGCFIRSNAMSFEPQVAASARLVLENLTLVCNSLTYTSIAKPQQLITDFVLESCTLTPLDFEMVTLLCDLREFITQDRLTMNNCVAMANFQGQNGVYTMRDTQFVVPPAFTGVALFTLQPGNRGQPAPYDRPIMRYYGGVIDRSTTVTASNFVLTSVRALFKSTLITASVLTRTGANSTVPRVLFPGCQFLAMPSATSLTFDTGEISLMGASYSALWLSAITNPNSKVDRDAYLIGVSSLARNTTTSVNIRPAFSDSLYTVEYAGNRIFQGNPPAPAAGGNIIPYTMERTPTSFSYYMNSPAAGDTNSFFDIIVRRYTTSYNSI